MLFTRHKTTKKNIFKKLLQCNQGDKNKPTEYELVIHRRGSLKANKYI